MDIFRLFRKTFQMFRFREISLHSAAVCYYTLLSLLPALVFLMSLSSTFLQGFFTVMPDFLPGELLDLFRGIIPYLQHTPSAALLSVSGVMSLWSGSKGIHALFLGLHVMLDSHPVHGFLRTRVRSVLRFILFIPAGLFMMIAATSFSPVMQSAAQFLTLSGILCILYCAVSGWRLPFYSFSSGAAAAALGWIGFTKIFSLYVRYVSEYPKQYGGLGLAILGCIWLKSCISVLLFGGRVCAMRLGN